MFKKTQILLLRKAYEYGVYKLLLINSTIHWYRYIHADAPGFISITNDSTYTKAYLRSDEYPTEN